MKKIIVFFMVLSAAFALSAHEGFSFSWEEARRAKIRADKLYDQAKSREELKKAAQAYEKALNIYERLGSKENVGLVCGLLGIVYRDLAESQKALKCLERSIAIRKKLKDLRGQGVALNNAGLVYQLWGEYEKALEYFERSLTIAKKRRNKKGQATVLRHMGQVYKTWGQPNRALEFYQRSLSLHNRIGYRSGQLSALNDIGTLHAELGSNVRALEYLEKALAIARKLGDQEAQADILDNMGKVFRELGEPEKAKEYSERSYAIARKLGICNADRKYYESMAIIHGYKGNYQKALEYHEKSLAISKKLGDRSREATALNNIGSVYRSLGQKSKALEYHEKSLAISKKLGDRSGEATSLGSVGGVYLDWGQYGKALENYQLALDLCRKTEELDKQSTLLDNIGLIYSAWGWYDTALKYAEEALALRRKLGYPKGEEVSHNNIAGLHFHWGRYEKALLNYEKSLAIAKKLGNPESEATILGNIGAVHQARSEYKEALHFYEKALALKKKWEIPTRGIINSIGDLYLDRKDVVKAESFIQEAGYQSSLGRLQLMKGRYKLAISYYKDVLKRTEKTHQVSQLFVAHTALGIAHERMDDFNQAYKCYQRAVKLSEEIRTKVPKTERERFFHLKESGYYRTVPYEGLARILMRLNKPLDAFRASEYSKARVFSEQIATRSKGDRWDVSQGIITKDRALNDQLAAIKVAKQKAYREGNKETIKALELEVQNFENKFLVHLKMIRHKYPLFAATKYPEPMDLVQAGLKECEWVLSYDVTDWGLIAYLTKGKNLVKAVYQPVDRIEIDGLVRKFREPFKVGPGSSLKKKLASFDFASGKKLADILLGDILPELPQGIPVIIVPDDSLGVLPFEMLVLNNGGEVKTDKKIPYVTGAKFFGDRNPISYYQSVTALTLARTIGKRTKSATKVLVMDDPVFTAADPRLKRMAQQKKKLLLSSLPDKLMSIKNEIGLTFPRLSLTSELGRALKKIDLNRTDEYSGLKACKPLLFRSPLHKYGSMVFATHGYFGKDLPGIQEPVLVLTLVDQPKGTDGFLRMSEVMGLKLNADIVALTACQTGLGRRITGEGVMGMGRAFQYAGAKSVLMSLWSVAEASSVTLVESFFKHLKEGKNKLEALQMARKEIREAGYDHPFYWAPFILVGEVK